MPDSRPSLFQIADEMNAVMLEDEEQLEAVGFDAQEEEPAQPPRRRGRGRRGGRRQGGVASGAWGGRWRRRRPTEQPPADSQVNNVPSVANPTPTRAAG
jgi:hypothetical protein